MFFSLGLISKLIPPSPLSCTPRAAPIFTPFDRDRFSFTPLPATLSNRRFFFFFTPFRTGLMTVVDWCGSYITWKSAINCREFTSPPPYRPAPLSLRRLTSHANKYRVTHRHRHHLHSTAGNNASIKSRVSPLLPRCSTRQYDDGGGVKNKLRVINDVKEMYVYIRTGFSSFYKNLTLTFRLTTASGKITIYTQQMRNTWVHFFFHQTLLHFIRL